jgi:LuxR family transcriptional regulator, maltose regulon positive regulatory protein
MLTATSAYIPHTTVARHPSEAPADGAGGPIAPNATPPRRWTADKRGSTPQAGQLLRTRLLIPQLRDDLVPRPQLTARLTAGLGGALTIVSAPSGFGKTTLLASWLQQLAAEGHRNTAFAWLALDAADGLDGFTRYLAAAIGMAVPEIAPQAEALAEAELCADAWLAALLNTLAALPRRLILVLDDCQALRSRPALGLLAALISSRPPQLHLAITTREELPLPLARPRAYRQLTELRAADLSFTPGEAELFLRDGLGLELAPAETARLIEQSEGWVAGLQLGAQALAARPARPAPEAEALGVSGYIDDYLASEVLDALPAHLRFFMLQTAVLDRLSGPLCDSVMDVAVGGPQPLGSPAYSQVVIEELERRNLFLVPLDAERRWYRYHHMVGAALRRRLLIGTTGGALARLHSRAAAWFESQGMLAEAQQHARAAAAVATSARQPAPQPMAARLAEPLTPRELEVLRLIAEGKTNGEIARALIVAVCTVKAHINNIFGKLNVTHRSAALAQARRLGLL